MIDTSGRADGGALRSWRLARLGSMRCSGIWLCGGGIWLCRGGIWLCGGGIWLCGRGIWLDGDEDFRRHLYETGRSFRAMFLPPPFNRAYVRVNFTLEARSTSPACCASDLVMARSAAACRGRFLPTRDGDRMPVLGAVRDMLLAARSSPGVCLRVQDSGRQVQA